MCTAMPAKSSPTSSHSPVCNPQRTSRPSERARSVEITGGADPVLPTPFRIGETSAAAVAATGLAVADLWELRTGRRQEVAVDLRHATASLRSGTYLQVNGAKVRGDRNPVMGMYPAKN